MTQVQANPEIPQTATEKALAQIWSDVLGVSSVHAEDDFFSLGGDSLLSIQVVSKAKSRGIPLDYRMIFRRPTIRQLAASLDVHYASKPFVAAVDEVPLTPIQRRFFESAGSDINHWNQWVLLDVKTPLRLQHVRLSVQQLLNVHDVLRLEFRFNGKTWTQKYRAQNAKTPLTRIDLSASSAGDRNDAMDVLNDEMNQGLSPEDANLIRIAYFDFGASGPHKLLIVAHHLIMDNVSFHLLVSDLDTCLNQCASGLVPRLESNTCTYKAWSEALNKSAQEGRFKSETDYWLTQTEPASPPIPRDMQADDTANTYGSARSCEIRFPEEQTLAIVNKLPALLHCHINSILLDALACGLFECFGITETVIDIESHGRQWIDDSVDLGKTTGWYTCIFPHRFSNVRHRGAHDRLRAIDEELRAVPNGGVGYGVLRYLSQSGKASSALARTPNAQVCFNYLGQVGRGGKGLATFSTANMRVGASHSEELQRPHLLLVQGAVIDGKLAVQCEYSARFHREDTIRRLLACMQRNMNGLLPAVAAGLRRSFRQLTWLSAEPSETVDVLQQIAVCYPLLGIQTSILFQHLSNQDGVTPYLVQVSCTLSGNLDTSAFEQAWQTVLARHESLRTSFHWAGLDTPVQAVHRSLPLSIKVLDWQKLGWQQKDATVQQTDLQNALRKDWRAGISLDGAEPLMRITLIQLADDRYFCIWTHHHIQLDGWSQVIILRELFQIYCAIVAGAQLALSSPPSLGDYFRALDRFPGSQARKYWQRYLRGFREPTPILTDALGPAAESSQDYRDTTFEIGTTESDAVHEFAKTNSLTLHTIFSTIWGLWLSIHSDRSEVLFGNVVSGRSADMPAVENLVGTVINTIPIRMLLDDGEFVLHWLKRVQDEQAISHRYELFPLAEAMKLAETAKGELLFNSILVFENLPASYEAPIAEAGLELQSINFRIQENYPVVVSIKPERPVTARINYRADIVDPRIRHAQLFFTIALAALTQDRGQTILQLRQNVREKYFESIEEKQVK